MIENEEVEEETKFTCQSCSADFEEDDIIYTDSDEWVCNDCAVSCERCGSMHASNDDLVLLDGGDTIWCQGCVDYYAAYCDSCNEYTTDDTCYIQDRSESWCDSCLGWATFCDQCDCYYADGCEDCTDTRYIHDWSYKPDAIFHSTNNTERLFFGVELEMEARNGSELSSASEYAFILEREDLAYLKNDGSLNQGMELVTHPMSYDFFSNHADELWETVEGLRTQYNMRSGDTSTCGIHIHISRTGFSGGPHMHRFLNLVYTNEKLFSKLAGRHSDRWAKFNDVQRWDDNGNGYKTFKSKLEHGSRSDRYSAVNTQNQHTLEMRIFKGSMLKDTLMAHLGLAHASVEYTRGLSVRDIANGALEPANFIAYLREHSDMYQATVERLDRRVPLSESV